MKTKLSFLFTLCCFLLLAFNSCQKDIVEPTTIESAKIPISTENFMDELTSSLPSNVIVKPIGNLLNDVRIGTIEDQPYPIGIPNNCRDTNCFDFILVYQELQGIANFTCNPIQRRLCCCFKGYYRCFIMEVLPNKLCLDSLGIGPIDIVIIDERVPEILKKQ